MINRKVLTLAIAAYNVEEVIGKCLNSILECDESTLQLVDVVIINDGSTDNTKAIIEEYAQRRSDLFQLINKENEGYGSTFSVAFAAAKGKYYKVLDSDDWIDPQELSKLVGYLSACDDDLVITNYYSYDNETAVIKKEKLEFIDKSIEYGKSYNICEKQNGFETQFIGGTVVKTKLLYDNAISVCKVFYTDLEFISKIFTCANTISFFDIYVTVYRKNQKANSSNYKSMAKNAWQFEAVCMAMLDYYKNTYKDNKNLQIVSRHISYQISAYVSALLLNKISREIYEKLVELVIEMEKDSYILIKNSFSRRMQLIISLPKLYPLMSVIYRFGKGL